MRRPILLALSLIALSAGAAPPTPPDPSLLPPRVEQAIRARITHGDYPSLVVAVIDGEREHVYTFGKLADGEAPDPDTVYQIGSVTKTFTATLLAADVARHEVELDTPVATLLPGWHLPSRNGKAITLGELAMQDSGLPRLPGNLDPQDAGDPYASYGAARLKAFLDDYQLTRDPGSRYEYSNLGVGLLGFALARHAGLSYPALVEARILAPLGMAATGATLGGPAGKHWAAGHGADGNTAKPWHFDALAGAGALHSTGADMLKYLAANMGRGSGPLRDAMHVAQQPRRKIAGDESIGLAWMTRHDKDGDVVWHNGMTGGYASFIGLTADGRRGVVILTNIARTVDDLGFAALLPDAPIAAMPARIAMTPAQLDGYVGDYRLAPGFTLHVFRQDDQLLAQATGQDAFAIYPSARDAFFARVAGIRIDFRRGKDGAVESLVLHQGGHDSPAPKQSAAAGATPGRHKAVELDSATLHQYVGRYRLAPGAVFDITLDHGQLKAQLTGQPAFPVYPSARDEFFYTVVDARLSFLRGADGKVEALVLRQNGADQRAARLPAEP